MPRTLILDDDIAATLFDWMEDERDVVLDIANDTDEDDETRKVSDGRYRAAREIMGQLGAAVVKPRRYTVDGLASDGECQIHVHTDHYPESGSEALSEAAARCMDYVGSGKPVAYLILTPASENPK